MTSDNHTRIRYIDITPTTLAIHAINMALEALLKINAGNVDAWIDAIQAFDLALNSALVAALAQSNSMGAVDRRIENRTYAIYEQDNFIPSELPELNRIANMAELLSRLELLWTTEKELLALLNVSKSHVVKLNNWRDQLIHVKPILWAFPAPDTEILCWHSLNLFEVLTKEPRFAIGIENLDRGPLDQCILLCRKKMQKPLTT